MNRRQSIALAALGGGLAAAYAAGQTRRRRRALDFAGKVVVITGGSRGLGLVLARRFAAEGARVAILARKRDELDRAADELARRGADALPVVCDVRYLEEKEQ